MRLADWLKERRWTGTDLANAIGVDDSTINRLIPKPGKKQRRRPGRVLLRKIVAATGGEVTANDFMDDDPELTPVQSNVSKAVDPSDAETNSARRDAGRPQREKAA